jgi:hypothetical protein
LLAADNCREPAEALFALTQRRHSRRREDRFESRILFHESVDGLFEVSLALEMDRHADWLLSSRGRGLDPRIDLIS